MTDYEIETVGDLLQALNSMIAVNPDVINAAVCQQSYGCRVRGAKSTCNDMGFYGVSSVVARSPHEINIVEIVLNTKKNCFDVVRKKHFITANSKYSFKKWENLCEELSALGRLTPVLNIIDLTNLKQTMTLPF